MSEIPTLLIMTNVKHALIEFGFSARQADIYLTLRKQGRLSITEIARFTGIPRVSVYSCLGELQQQGVISCLKKNRRQVFEAQAPSILLEMLKRKAAIFESSLPLLKLIEPTSVGDSVRIYEGYEQSRQAQIDLYEQLAKEKIKVVQSITHPDLAKKFPKFVPLMIERRRQMGISTRLLISASQKQVIPKSFGGQNREIRYLPGKFPFNCTCIVGGSSILFILTNKKEPSALLIQSSSVSGMISSCLAFIWEQLEVKSLARLA